MHTIKFKQHKGVKKAIKLSIQEDVGDGDITTSLLVSDKLIGKAEILVKENCIIGGIEVAKLICAEVDKNIQVNFYCKDGSKIKALSVIGELKGPIASILRAERILLNFMQRMSGIATKTNQYVYYIKK